MIKMKIGIFVFAVFLFVLFSFAFKSQELYANPNSSTIGEEDDHIVVPVTKIQMNPPTRVPKLEDRWIADAPSSDIRPVMKELVAEAPSSNIRPGMKEMKLLGGKFTTEGSYDTYVSAILFFSGTATKFNWVSREIFCRHMLVAMASFFVNFSIFWHVQIQNEGKAVIGVWYEFLEFLFMLTWSLTLLVLAHIMVAHVTLVWFRLQWVRMVRYFTPLDDLR